MAVCIHGRELAATTVHVVEGLRLHYFAGLRFKLVWISGDYGEFVELKAILIDLIEILGIRRTPLARVTHYSKLAGTVVTGIKADCKRVEGSLKRLSGGVKWDGRLCYFTLVS
jgi:hypothetical protein